MAMFISNLEVNGVYALDVQFTVEAEYQVHEGEVDIISFDVYRKDKLVTKELAKVYYSKLYNKTLERICLG